MADAKTTFLAVGDIVSWRLVEGRPPFMLTVKRGRGPLEVTHVRNAPKYGCNCRDYGHEPQQYVRGHHQRCRTRESPHLSHPQEVRVLDLQTKLEFQPGYEPGKRAAAGVRWLSASFFEFIEHRPAQIKPGDQLTFGFA